MTHILIQTQINSPITSLYLKYDLLYESNSRVCYQQNNKELNVHPCISNTQK